MYNAPKEYAYAALDSVSIAINPSRPKLMDDDRERQSIGFVSVSFPGNGFFSWRSNWNEVARHYLKTAAVVEVQKICREHFPVPEDGRQESLAKTLAELYLNRGSRQAGDWVLTVDESE